MRSIKPSYLVIGSHPGSARSTVVDEPIRYRPQSKTKTWPVETMHASSLLAMHRLYCPGSFIKSPLEVNIRLFVSAADFMSA